MSDRHEGPPPQEQPPETSESEAPQGSSAAFRADGASSGPGRAALLVGAFLVAVVIAVIVAASGPLWTPLLPWGIAPSADSSLAARIDQLAAAQEQIRKAGEQTRQQAEQAGRQAQAGRQQLERDAAAATGAVQQFGKRLDALEARPVASPDETARYRNQLTTLSGAVAELATRVGVIEKNATVQSAHDARDTTDIALALVMLQIRGALDTGRPFAAEYQAVAKLGQNRPEFASAAELLAAPAKTGVATRAVLAKGLHDINQAILATEPATDAAPGWEEAALARLRGLVTIRRLDKTPASGPGAAIGVAETALAGGDLAAAVAQLASLTGDAAEAAAPWLRMARARLEVEGVLHRLETSLTGRLGEAAASPGTATQ